MIDYDATLRGVLKPKAATSLILMVNTQGDPKPDAKWYLGDKQLLSDANTTVEGDGTFSRLTVKGSGSKDSGTYRVTAENEVGSDSAEFQVVVQGKL